MTQHWTSNSEWTSFEKDNTRFENAAAIYAQSMTDVAQARSQFQEEIQAISINPNSSWESVGNAFMMLMLIFAGGGMQVQSGDTAVTGDAMKVQGDLTRCQNDLQNMMNRQPTGEGHVHGGHKVKMVASGLDILLNELNGSTPETKALGPETSSSVFSEFKTMRQTIYWAKDPTKTWNPAPYTGSSAPTSPPYYFDPSGKKGEGNSPWFMQSFGQMQRNMGKTGDPDNANEASQVLTNAENEITSATQGANAVVNQQMTQQSNSTQAIETFLTDALHAMQQISAAAINIATQIAG